MRPSKPLGAPLTLGLVATFSQITSAIQCEFLDDQSTISLSLKTFPKETVRFLVYKYSDVVSDSNKMIGWSFDQGVPLIDCQQTSATDDTDQFKFRCSSFDSHKTTELDSNRVTFVPLKELNYQYNVTDKGFYCAQIDDPKIGHALNFQTSNRSAVSFIVHYASYPIILMFIPILLAMVWKINMDITYITIQLMFYSIVTTYSLSVANYFRSIFIDFLLIVFQSLVDLGCLAFIFTTLTERANLGAQGENMCWLFVGMLSRFATMMVVFGVKLIDPLAVPVLGFSPLDSLLKGYLVLWTLGFISSYVAFLYKGIEVHKTIEDQREVYSTLILIFGYPLIYTFIWIILHLFIWMKNYQFLDNFVDDWFAMGSSMLDNTSFLVFVSLLVYIHWGEKTIRYSVPEEDIELRQSLV